MVAGGTFPDPDHRERGDQGLHRDPLDGEAVVVEVERRVDVGADVLVVRQFQRVVLVLREVGQRPDLHRLDVEVEDRPVRAHGHG